MPAGFDGDREAEAGEEDEVADVGGVVYRKAEVARGDSVVVGGEEEEALGDEVDVHDTEAEAHDEAEARSEAEARGGADANDVEVVRDAAAVHDAAVVHAEEAGRDAEAVHSEKAGRNAEAAVDDEDFEDDEEAGASGTSSSLPVDENLACLQLTSSATD